MITLVAALILSRTQDLPAAKTLVGRMFLRYYNASSVRGKIRLTVTAPTGSGTVDTDLQLQRPGKLYLHQTKNAGEKQEWLVTADGTAFTYDPPRGTVFTSDSRLLEKIGPNEPVKDLKDAYGASVLSIYDRSVPLDVAVARTTDLDHFRYQLASIKTEMETELGSKKAYVVDGDWREYGNGPVQGKFQIYVSAEGDLYKYVISQMMQVPGANLPPQQIVQTWDVDLTVNGPVDAKLFNLVK